MRFLKRLFGCRRDRERARGDSTSLGRLLVDNNLIDNDDLNLAIQFQDENPDLMLGDALVRMGVIDKGLIEAMLVMQEARRGKHRNLAKVIDFGMAHIQKFDHVQDHFCEVVNTPDADKKIPG